MLGYVYKISCNIPDSECYVGSTINNPRLRLNVHRYMAKRHPHTKVYKYINDNGGFSNVTLEVLETVTGTKEELLQKERAVLERENATLNTFVPSRTKNEWYEATREERWAKMREYYEKNREQLRTRMREYYAKHRELNRDKYNAYQRAYYRRRKEKAIEFL